VKSDEILLFKKIEDTNYNNKNIEEKVNKFLNNEYNKEIFKLFSDMRMYALHRNIFSVA